MRSKLPLLILLVILLVSPIAVRATDLRGRIDGINPYTQIFGPLPGVPITLFAPMQNGTFTIVAQAMTGPDGFYYFRGIYPGQYVLQIAGVNYPLGVGGMPTQDIPIIRR